MDKWTTAPLRSRSCPLAHSLYYDCCNDCCGATLTERRRRYLNQGRSRVLTNPSTSLSQLEMIRIFEEVGGRPFEVQHVPADALEEQQKGATDPMQQSFLGLMRCYAADDPIDMRETLKAFPVQLTSVREYARSAFGTA